MAVTIARKLTLAFFVAVAMIAGVGLVSYRATRELAEATARLNEGRLTARDLGRAVQGLQARLSDAREDVGEAPAARAQGEVDAALTALAPRTRNSPELASVVARLDIASRRLEAATLAQGATPHLPPEVAEVATDALDASHAYVRALDAELAARAFRAAGTARTSGFLLRVAFIAFLLLVPFAFVILRRELRDRVDAEAELLQSEARLRAAADGGLDAFYVLRALRDAHGEVLDFEFVDLNRKAEGLLGRPRDEVVGQRLCELIPANRGNGFLEKYVRVMAMGTVFEEDVEITTPDVRAAWIHHQVVPLGDGVAITSRDITDKKQQEEALRALSLVDELTGLYNRRGFLTLAQQQLKLARRGSREVVLLFVDMDDFKEINDTFGHKEGDIALQRAAGILRRTFRDSDILARLGGDEFVVLAADIAHGTGDVIVQRLKQELRVCNERDGFPYLLSFSVGLATFDPVNPPSIEELLATADGMLYEQKRHKDSLPAGL